MSTSQSGKDLSDFITIFVAGYGAILATIIFLKDLAKERKSLKIILEAVHWAERHQILITNTSHRPITITTINLNIIPKNRRGGFMNMSSGVFWATEAGFEPPRFPLTLQDGDSVTFHLSQYITDQLSDETNRLSIRVYDSEGRTYAKYTEGIYDIKYEYREPKPKYENFHNKWLNIKYKIKKVFGLKG
jgi:hypothetical protein